MLMSLTWPMVIDHAKTSGEDAASYYSIVEPMDSFGVSVPVDVHAAFGGKHDAPQHLKIFCVQHWRPAYDAQEI